MQAKYNFRQLVFFITSAMWSQKKGQGYASSPTMYKMYFLRPTFLEFHFWKREISFLEREISFLEREISFLEKEDLIFGKGDLIFGKGRSHFWKRKISFLEKEDLIFGKGDLPFPKSGTEKVEELCRVIPAAD